MSPFARAGQTILVRITASRQVQEGRRHRGGQLRHPAGRAGICPADADGGGRYDNHAGQRDQRWNAPLDGDGALIPKGVKPAKFQRALTERDPNLNRPAIVVVRLRNGVPAAAGGLALLQRMSGKDLAKRNLGFVLAATVGGPPRSLRHTNDALSAARRNSATTQQPPPAFHRARVVARSWGLMGQRRDTRRSTRSSISVAAAS